MESTKASPVFKLRRRDGDEEDSDNDVPREKISRLSGTSEEYSSDLELDLNGAYQRKDINNWLQTTWEKKASTAKEDTTGAQIYGEPFQICILPELLENAASASNALVHEMINKVHWSRKQMDLYEFYQSTDLFNMNDCPVLTNFLRLLRQHVRPWLEQLTNLKLDYVSASCSMYTCGDYLLVHDDLLKDRQIAFIYYLSPWDGAQEWQESHGGCLEIFGSDEQCFPQFPVQRKIAPKNNQFAFFKVGSRSFHQVGEVTTYDYPRLTINGWFHGATNDAVVDDATRVFSSLRYEKPDVNRWPMLDQMLNVVYLKTATQRSIQKRIEENSEICLYEFFKRDQFEKARTQLLSDTSLVWKRQGPANAHNYEVLDLKSSSKAVGILLQLFRSDSMFSLLREFTDLDFYGSNALTPMCSIELQRWSHGNYTVLGDGLAIKENVLDLVYYINASEGAAVITYLAAEEEEEEIPPPTDSEEDEVEDKKDPATNDPVLLTITPVDNALNIVYRCRGTTKFTKYVSRNMLLDKGPVFVICCSYKE